jgi:hypothetical protein
MVNQLFHSSRLLSHSVARALEADTERLEHEWHAYDDEVKARQERLRGLEKTLASSLFSPSFDESHEGTLER